MERSSSEMERYKPPTTKVPFHIDKGYHVFLSFRGKDVRKTLVDHLYEALSAAGLNVYKDDEKLEKGKRIWPSLNTAIESSAIRIPIFSKGYAGSAWCLKEAAAMLSTPGSIIPLFYHVDPTDVRHPENESSPYSQSFLKHYGHPDRYQSEEVDGWKRALEDICERSGWSMDITGGFEARLVKTVVNDLIKTLDRVPLHVAKHPVGIDNLKNALIQDLNLNSGDAVLKVGIWGIGGIGKTTVAKAVYNQVYAHFNAASFVFDVQVTAEAKGLTKLQEKVLRDLCKYDGKVDSVPQGISLFRDRLGRNSVLLILDDVYTVEQLDGLVGDWLAPGSRVIITSRNKDIFKVAGVSSERIHEMTGLKINESLQLFSWHAFLKESPSSGYEDLCTKIVKACKGHPLSLTVIGSSLFEKQDDKIYWTQTLDNITRNQEIYRRLYISYSDLSPDEKEIFVDIACFFIGEGKTLPIAFWNSLYNTVEAAVHNLSMKLLINIDDKDVFQMHDHLRDMGRTIAEKEENRTRLWRAAHLSTPSNLTRLRLNGGNLQMVELLLSRNLCYLHLQNLCIEGKTKDIRAMLPRSLIWLRLEDCHFAIEMNGEVEKPSHSRFMENAWQSKIMQLKGCTDLDGRFISSLFSPHINLSKLQHLSLESCVSLNNLPITIGNLSQLQHLDLRSCVSLNNLPITIGNLSQLQHLDLRCCIRLNNLPETIGNLLGLEYLYLGKCESLNNLPNTIGGLSQLKHLDLEKCINLTNLPNTIGNLSQLQHLNLKWCASLKNLPDTIGNLSQLRKLELRGCERLKILPPPLLNLQPGYFF